MFKFLAYSLSEKNFIIIVLSWKHIFTLKQELQLKVYNYKHYNKLTNQ